MAIARAVAGQRRLLLADEPTGALDSVNGEAVMRLLRADRIGVALSEEFQLAPEQSTDAIIAHHQEAKYFST